MEIQHDKEKQRFFVKIDNKEAELTYKKVEDNVLNFDSTFTPEELRGQGLAGKITKAALEYAQAHNLKVIPGCPYVEKYIEKHSEFESILAD